MHGSGWNRECIEVDGIESAWKWMEYRVHGSGWNRVHESGDGIETHTYLQAAQMAACMSS